MPHTRRPVTTLVVVMAATLLMAAAPALADDYPPRPGPVIDADVVVETPNARVEVDGRDWGPDTVVDIDYDASAGGSEAGGAGTSAGAPDADGGQEATGGSDGRVRLGQATTDADGSFSATVDLPEGADPEQGAITVTERAERPSEGGGDGGDGSQAVPATASVALADAGSGADGDAVLASDSVTKAGVGLLVTLIVAGAGALAFARWNGRRLHRASQ